MTDPALPSDVEMRAFLLRFIQDARHRELITVPTDNEREFLVLFGLVQRVRRLAQAYLRLDSAGFGNEASALVRAALEHAVTAQWAYLTPGGVDRLHVTLARAQADLASGMTSYSKDPEWVTRERQLRDAIPPGPGLPKFTGTDGIMAALDSISFLAVSYRVLSQVGHVTHQAPLDFIVETEGVVRLRKQPEAENHAEVMYALTGFCMLVAWLHARLEGDDAEVIRLKEMSVRLHVPWRLDTHLTDDRRRFPGEDTNPET
ncbi:hypothetical protein ACX3O0_07040 [Homoserinimonas sp. A447]